MGKRAFNICQISHRFCIDTKKIKALGLNETKVFAAIAKLSYIYPIGEVEDSAAGFHYISTFNGPKSAQKMLDSKINLQGTHFYLRDIATIQKRYEDAASLFSIDGNAAVDIAIKQRGGFAYSWNSVSQNQLPFSPIKKNV